MLLHSITVFFTVLLYYLINKKIALVNIIDSIENNFTDPKLL